MKEDINEIINNIPNIDINMKYLIDNAEHLFRNVEIRMSYKKSAADETKMLLIFYLNNSLSLWFYEKDGKLEYDGWEMGDYSTNH